MTFKVGKHHKHELCDTHCFYVTRIIKRAWHHFGKNSRWRNPTYSLLGYWYTLPDKQILHPDTMIMNPAAAKLWKRL